MILGFEQISEKATAIVLDKKLEIVASHFWNPKETRDLLINLVKVLKKAKTKLGDLKGIFMINGPGNFTPVRTSCVIANALANELGIPIYETSSEDFEKFMKKYSGKNEAQILLEIFKSKKLKPRKSVSAFFGKEPNIS